MSRLNAPKSTIVLAIALVALGLAAAGPSSSPAREAAPSPAPLASSVEPAACQGDEPLFFTAPAPENPFSTAPAPEGGFEPATPGCKKCNQQPWCGCTYQGHPRISCDPCCYAAFPAPICLS